MSETAKRPSAYVALGAQRYRVTHVSNPMLSGISDVAVIGDRIVVLRRQAPELVMLGLDGTMLGETAVLPQFVCGHGLRATSASQVAATDMDGHKVVLLDGTLQETARMDCAEHPGLGRPFNHPCDCTQGPDGRYYVADGYGLSLIHI